MAKVPARILWAVELLDVQPDDRILEFGFGPGLSLELVCERLEGDGQIVGIDRSATAVGRAEQRLAAQVASGRLTLTQMALNRLTGPTDHFDKALGVNVNVFWTGPADAELETLAHVLRPGGLLRLVYEGPPGGRPDKVLPAATANLQRHGFAVEVVDGPTSNLLCVVGRRPPVRSVG